MAVRITKVNGVDVVNDAVTIDNPDGGIVQVEGDGMKKAESAVCTLTAHLTRENKDHSSTKVQQRYITAHTDGTWTASFDGFRNDTDDRAIWRLTCDPEKSEPPNTVKIIVPAGKVGVSVSLSSSILPCSAFVAVAGSVTNGLDSVMCTMTPINLDGSRDFNRPPPQNVQAIMNSTGWAAMFTPNPATPPAQPNVYSGRYLLQAIAQNEGFVTTTFTI